MRKCSLQSRARCATSSEPSLSFAIDPESRSEIWAMDVSWVVACLHGLRSVVCLLDCPRFTTGTGVVDANQYSSGGSWPQDSLFQCPIVRKDLVLVELLNTSHEEVRVFITWADYYEDFSSARRSPWLMMSLRYSFRCYVARCLPTSS